ncbi:MAG: hypothetical protein IT364_04615 [Candidatus Hydrogenedentes bacterium]|nr:hypothetical protein [Candidatus Hydrogenedentota bacterium]
MIAAFLQWVLERTWFVIVGVLVFAFFEAYGLSFILPESGKIHFHLASSAILVVLVSGRIGLEKRVIEYNRRALSVLPMDRRWMSRITWASYVALLPALFAFAETSAWILKGGWGLFSIDRMAVLTLHWVMIMGGAAMLSIEASITNRDRKGSSIKLLFDWIAGLGMTVVPCALFLIRDEPVGVHERLLFLTGAAFSIPLVWLSYRLAPLAWSPQTRFRSAKVEWFSNVGHARPQELQRPAGGGFLALGAVGLAAGFAVASLIAAVAALTSVLYSASDTPEFPRLLICCFAGLFALDGHRLDPRATRSLPRSRTGIANLHAGTILLSFIPGLLLAPVFAVLFGIPFLVPVSLLALVAGLNVMWRGFTLGLDRSVERVCTFVVVLFVILGLPNFPPSPAAFFILAILLTTGGWSLIRMLLNKSYVYQKAWEPESSQ